jgi:hypothetical protein
LDDASGTFWDNQPKDFSNGNPGMFFCGNMWKLSKTLDSIKKHEDFLGMKGALVSWNCFSYQKLFLPWNSIFWWLAGSSASKFCALEPKWLAPQRMVLSGMLQQGATASGSISRLELCKYNHICIYICIYIYINIYI